MSCMKQHGVHEDIRCAELHAPLELAAVACCGYDVCPLPYKACLSLACMRPARLQHHAAAAGACMLPRMGPLHANCMRAPSQHAMLCPGA